MPKPLWIPLLVSMMVGIWPLAIFLRRWWVKPYRDPKRLMKGLCRTLRLTRSEIKQLKKLNPQASDPMTFSRFLLDPSLWPVAPLDEGTNRLHAKVFRSG